MPSQTPIIFIHYGPARYLRNTLRCSRISNKAKSIFLLGDESNKSYAKWATKHVSLEKLEASPNIKRFEKVFEPIQGKLHHFTKHGGVEKWLNFVFRRWFLINEFLRQENIESFWTFDSDTLILAPLENREKRFRSYQGTTQCRDCCLNGFIGSQSLVEKYTQCIIDLFGDRSYLKSQKERLEKQAGLAFNEMDAFCEFRKRNNIRTYHAGQPLQEEFLDDSLAYDGNFEVSPHKVSGRIEVKRLWTSPSGGLYARHLASGDLARMITVNLSWLPDYIGRKLARFSLTPEEDSRVVPPKETEMVELDLSQPVTDKFLTALKKRFYQSKAKLWQ